jgi:cytochrome c oxidase subunit II
LQGSRLNLVLRSVVLSAGALALWPASAAALTLTPESPASPPADDTRLAYLVMMILAGLLALAVIAAMVAALRRGRADRASTRLERRTRGTSGIQRRVGAALTALALAVFVFGILVTESATEVEPNGPESFDVAALTTEPEQAPGEPGGQPDEQSEAPTAEPLRISAAGQQWLWRFEYPDGTFSYYELVVPVDTTVVLDLISTDVLHRWWVPALGPMADAMPGSDNETWFKATETGEYEGRSTFFSGPAFATMRTVVRVVEHDEFEQWLAGQADDIAAAQDSVQQQVEAGTAPGVAIQGGAGTGDGQGPSPDRNDGQQDSAAEREAPAP